MDELTRKNIDAIKEYTKMTRELVYDRDEKIKGLENRISMQEKVIEQLNQKIINLLVKINNG